MATASDDRETTGQGAGTLLLSAEQEAIIRSTGNIRINAVAGAGKTTTLIHYAAMRPAGARILYLAYNRSVRLEAQKRFAAQGLPNVQVETAHSLAYKAVVPRHNYRIRAQAYKTHEIAALLGLKATGEKHGEYILANHISKFMAYFCNSDAQKVQALDYRQLITDDGARHFVDMFYEQIEYGTRLLLAKMDKGEIDIIHDFYLKKYQLSNPVLPFDYILFDEGQDASPVMLDIFLKQRATKVIVGDTHQQIYGWRHAVNALEQTPFASYNLTTSFRFGADVARLAVAVLDWKKYLHDAPPVTMRGKGKAPLPQVRATLARTNLGLLVSAIAYITTHPHVKHLYFEGNIHAYTYADDGASLYDVLNLHHNNPAAVRDPLIRSMKTIAELEEYIEKTEDVQLAMMVEIVKEYGAEIPALLQTLKRKHVEDAEKEKAEMIFSTVHRAKGMEYDSVQLVADFVTEARLEKWKAGSKDSVGDADRSRWNEEINLLYVAVTRTRGVLRIPEVLLPRGLPSSPLIHVIKEAESKAAAARPGRAHSIMATDYAYSKSLSGDTAPDYRTSRLALKNGAQDWTSERDDALRALFHQGAKLPAIAQHFGCKTGLILARLKKLGCLSE